MSEDPITEPTSEAVPVDFDDVFDDWISGAEIAKRSVVIYGKPGLLARYEQLERDLKLAQARAKMAGDDAALGDDDEVASIEAQMGDLYEEWMASKSTWVVRALTDTEFDEIRAGVPEKGVKPEKWKRPPLVEPELPDAPEEPKLRPKATPNQRVDYEKAMHAWPEKLAEHKAAEAEYDKALGVYTSELNLRIAEVAVVSIEFADGRIIEAEYEEGPDGALVVVKPAITVDRLRKMVHQLGKRQIIGLIQASRLSMLAEAEIPAPFSQATSADDQT